MGNDRLGTGVANAVFNFDMLVPPSIVMPLDGVLGVRNEPARPGVMFRRAYGAFGWLCSKVSIEAKCGGAVMLAVTDVKTGGRVGFASSLSSSDSFSWAEGSESESTYLVGRLTARRLRRRCSSPAGSFVALKDDLVARSCFGAERAMFDLELCRREVGEVAAGLLVEPVV